MGFVVATDNFMSGWGHARGGRSLYALAITDPNQIDVVEANLRARSEMKRVRYQVSLPRLRAGDHLSIAGPEAARRHYERGGFA